jgi:4-carboxymuconolactone decarboxylase
MRCHGAVTVGEPSGSDGEIPGDSAQAGDEHEGFVEGQAGFGHDPAGPSALDPRAAALLRVGTCVATWSPGVRLESSTGRALAAGSAEDEIANALLAIAEVAGLGPVVVAAPDVATALGYDITAAREEPDDH